MNGNKTLYLILAVSLSALVGLGSAIYNSLAGQVARVAEEQSRRTSRLQALETRVEFSESAFRDVRDQLRRIEAEIVALRLVTAPRGLGSR